MDYYYYGVAVAQTCHVVSRAEGARSFLAALLHVAWTLAFASAFETLPLTLCRHVSRCLAKSSHAQVSINADRKSRLMTSLSNSGRPTRRTPSQRSP